MYPAFPVFPADNECAPLRFTHCLNQSFTATYATVSAHYDEQYFWLEFACFEKYPQPDYRFVLRFGEQPTELWLSSSQSKLIEGAVLLRDGGENLEGIYWGAKLGLPLTGQTLLCHGGSVYLCYDRAGECSSPFCDGWGRMEIVLEEKGKIF